MRPTVEEAVQALEVATRELAGAEEALAKAEAATGEARKALDLARRIRMNAEQKIIELIRLRVGGPGEKI
jgi:hypothetical protein